MRAVVLERYGGPEVLQLRDVPDLEPARGEVRVAVKATALNRADVLQRMGRYPQPGPKPAFEIPGLEFAGVVDRLGPEVSGFKQGDHVCGLLTGGGYAEQVVAHERMLIPVPESLAWEEATAIPEAFFTAFDALTDKGSLRAGDAVLVHAASSGVGTAAIQLARLLGARQVLATTRSPAKAERLESLGAGRVIVVAGAGFADEVLAATEGRGADVILDFIGPSYLEQNLKCAALEGRLVFIGILGGSKEAPLAVSQLLTRRLRLAGTSLRSRPIEQKMALTQRFIRELLPQFAAGRLRPVVDHTYPLSEAAEAHRRMESGGSFGKIVLTVA